MRIKRPESKCSECPLEGRKKVYSSGPEDAKIAIIGEAPGETEAKRGEPFVGPAGGWLRRALNNVGILPHRVHLTNVILCRPPGNKIDSEEGKEAIKCCRNGFIKEIDTLRKRGVKVFVPTGNVPIHAFGIEGNITKVRGSVFIRDFNEKIKRFVDSETGFLVLPTFHPSFIMRGQIKEATTWENDLEKVRKLAEKKTYKPLPEEFIIEPTIKEVEAFARKVIGDQSVLGLDIETTGLNPYYCKIFMVGFSIDSIHSFVIPLLDKGEKQYWKNGDFFRAKEAVREILAHCPVIVQNALFDVRVLEYNGYPIKEIADDTMIAHHVIHPELPHNLGYITSVYGQTPYWKGAVLGSEKRIGDRDQIAERTYNARDTVVLHQIMPELKKDLKRSGTEEIYEKISKPLIRPVLEMVSNGMLIDQRRLKSWRGSVMRKDKKLMQELRTLTKVPEGFNFDSDDHLRLLIYGDVAKQFLRNEEEFKRYEEKGNKLRRDTKKYRGIVLLNEVYHKSEPLTLPNFGKKKTEGGKISVDSESFLRIKIASLRRIDYLKNLRKPTKEHKKEIEGLKKTVEFVDAFFTYSENHKLLTTYTKFPVQPDGRVHFPYRITGTATGRLASGDKKVGEAGNAQNIPSIARRLFIAPEGYLLCSADYVNLELVIIAYASDDKPLIEVFKKGGNAHDENTKMLFDIGPDDPRWKTYRHAAKIYRFSQNYGATVRGSYEQVMLNAPGFDKTFAEFKKINDKYNQLHPNYFKWRNWVENEVRTKRTLSNGFGRKRYFLDHADNAVRQGLDFVPQSTAADVINTATIALYREREESGLGFKMIGQVHDELLFEVPEKEKKKTEIFIKKIMTRPNILFGKEVKLEVEIGFGRDWSELK
jgi:uracil-DNA glycosylase family 4